jgi:hypothetical protein
MRGGIWRKSSNVNEYVKKTTIIDHEINEAQSEYNDANSPDRCWLNFIGPSPPQRYYHVVCKRPSTSRTN